MSDTTLRAADGAKLAITSAGHGHPLIVIPGLGSSRGVMAPLVPLLASSFHVVIIDQRGIGDSQRGSSPYTVSQLASDVLAVLEYLRFSSAAILGASFGGLVAQECALDYPSRVSHLILTATSPGESLVRRDAAADAALLGRGTKSPAEAYRLACTVLYSQTFQEQHPEFIDEQVAFRLRHPVDPRVFREQFAASRGWDRAADLPQLQSTPTLIMHGSEDRIIPPAGAEVLHQQIPNSILRWMQGGHLFFHEQPEVTAAAVREFIR